MLPHRHHSSKKNLKNMKFRISATLAQEKAITQSVIVLKKLNIHGKTGNGGLYATT